MNGNKLVTDLIAGARPNFVKISPLYDIFKSIDWFEPRFIYTGQHSDPVMSSFLFDILDLPKPYTTLGINKKFGVDYFADMLKAYNNFVNLDKPDIVVLVGDTDSTLAGAIVAHRNNISTVHVEAGVRCFNDGIEETNRRYIDSISDLLLIPIESAEENLINERCNGEISLVGNVMIDSLVKIQNRLEDVEDFDILVTVHRQENVDNKNFLVSFVKKLDNLFKDFKIIFPVHPRTKAKLSEFNIKKRDYMVEPMLYDKFLSHIKNSKLVITDSGGVQTEAAFFRKKCLLLSDVTGWDNLIGNSIVLSYINNLEENVYENIGIQSDEIFDFGWDGTACVNIINSIYDYMVA